MDTVGGVGQQVVVVGCVGGVGGVVVVEVVSETDGYLLCWPVKRGSPQSIGFGFGHVSLGEAGLARVRTAKHLHVPPICVG